ncbi:hypothetical protein DYB30_007218 [Aphanomyces astaci]|uniref:MATE efflux family protein n=2 Tax=Aphanomyces astaci TaxID=112090 RepID=A0A397DP93_APHAT|nr:hypothetical protein DYB30_007218 [Aphanomyces astaci]
MLDLPTTSDEKSPLLHATVSINTIRALCTDPSLLRELREMAGLALPVVRTPRALYGHAGNSEDAVQSTLYLDAAAIAIMYMNVTGVTIGLGLATAMDTLCPQAVGGGIFVCVPIGLVNAWATAILVMLGQSHDIAVLAGDLIRIMVPSLPFLFGFELLKKPMLTCAVIGNCVNAALGYFLTFHWGVHGAALARSVANACLLWSLLVYFFELLVFVAGMSTPIERGHRHRRQRDPGQRDQLHLHGALWGALGAGLIHNARQTVQSAVVLGASIGLAFAALLVGMRHALRLFFTQDADVIRLTAFVTVAIAMYQVADALTTTLQGVLRGLGLQHMGAVLNFVAYVVVGVPLGVLLDFYAGWGLLGLWVGMAVGISTSGGCGAWVVYTSDWAALANAAAGRLVS